MKFKNTILFSSKNIKKFKSLTWLKKRQNFDEIVDIYTNKSLWRKEINVMKWLNTGKTK